MMDVRCCCDPGLVVGEIRCEDGLRAGLNLRELDDGTSAFDSEDRPVSELEAIPGFIQARKGGNKGKKGGKKGGKTWKHKDSKTWKHKDK